MYNCLECEKEIAGRINACPYCGRAYSYVNDVDVPYDIYERNVNLAWIWGENPTRKDFINFMCNHYKFTKKEAKEAYNYYKKSVGWKKMQKEMSVLSIVALILSLINIFMILSTYSSLASFIAAISFFKISMFGCFIISIIDLSIKDKKHNHDASIVAIILNILVIIAM
ncbi:hypothetical protein ACTNBM_13880 [Lachnospiraceae bacterium HCP1S3_C3]